MRTIITAQFLILFSQSAGALTTGDLYKFCKSYTDAGFDISKMEDSVDALICQSYFDAIGGLLGQACFVTSVNIEISDMKPNYEPENIEATIQEYVNTMSESPEYWKFDAALAVALSHKNISGECPN
jgi:hypothetical protein